MPLTRDRIPGDADRLRNISEVICFERGGENVYHTPPLISLRRAQIIKLIDPPGYHE